MKKTVWTGILSALVVVGFTAGCASQGEAAPEAEATGEAVDLGVPLPADIAERGHFNVGVKCDYPPFGYIDENDENAGYEISFARGLAAQAFGDPDAVEFECVSAANRVSMLTNGRIDMLIATLGKTPDREEVMTYSARPYFLSGHSILVQGDSDIESWEDLQGETVISLTGSTGTQVLQSCFTGIGVQEYESVSDALMALGQDRGVAFVYDTSFFAGLVPNNDQYSLVDNSIGPNGAGIGLDKGNTELQAWIDAAMDALAEEDRFWGFFTEWVDNEEVVAAFDGMIPRQDAPLEWPEVAPEVAC